MKDIKAVLETYYGLKNADIAAAKGGWSALAYSVKAGSGSYFLKVYDKSRVSLQKYIRQIDVYTPLLILLNDDLRLKGRIPEPILTLCGGYKHEAERYIYVLYGMINGETIGDDRLNNAEAAELAETVSYIHSLTAELKPHFPFGTDDFDISFSYPFSSGVIPDELITDETEAVMENCSETLKESALLLKDLSETVRNTVVEYVLCHTDLHNYNLMRVKDKLVILDWEGIKLAPAEADFIFVRNEPYFEDFLVSYTKIRKRFELGSQAMRFYMLRRRFEDMAEWREQALFENDGSAVEHLLTEIKNLHSDYTNGSL